MNMTNTIYVMFLGERSP